MSGVTIKKSAPQVGASLLVFSVVLLGPGLAQGPAGDVDYSMTMQVFEDGQPQEEIKAYFTEGAYRMDNPDSTMIFLSDEGRALFFDHESKSYLEMPTGLASQDSPLAGRLPGEQAEPEEQGECVEVGQDTIAGVSATKMSCEYDGEKSWVWFDPNGITLQMAEGEETNVVMKVLEFEVAPQPASLFTPLSGYDKKEMPTGLPGNTLP